MKNTNKTINVWLEKDGVFKAIYIDNPLIAGYGSSMYEAVNNLKETERILNKELEKMVDAIMGDKNDENTDEIW